MFYEDALTAARALELTLTSRSKDSTGGAIPMCGVPYHAADGYIAPSRQERLPRRRLRADGRSAEGQGTRPTRSRAGRVAGHPDRRRVSRRARARVPDGRRSSPGAGLRRGACSTFNGEFTTAEYMGATPARRSPTSSRCSGRARSWRPRVRRRDERSCELRLETRLTAADVDVRVRAARAALLAQLRAQTLHGFGLDDRRAATCAAGALVQYLARHAEGGLRTCATSPSARAPTRGDRPDDAPESRGDRIAPTAAGPARCCTKSIGRSPPWAAGCCAHGCCGRWWRSNASRIGWTRSRTSRFAGPERAKSATR